MGWRFFGFPVALAALVLFAGLSGCQSRLDQKAPDFELTALNGEKVRLSQAYEHQPVLLVFWASWCPTCQEEIPDLNALAKRYPPERLRILAVNVQESLPIISNFLRSHPVEYPVLLDKTGEVSAKYKIEGLPVSVLLAKGGEILYYGFSLPSRLDEFLGARRQ